MLEQPRPCVLFPSALTSAYTVTIGRFIPGTPYHEGVAQVCTHDVVNRERSMMSKPKPHKLHLTLLLYAINKAYMRS